MAALQGCSEDSKSQTSTTSGGSCSLLNMLPSELRNHIYDAVLDPPDSGIEIDLLSANPPSKALLLTCSQVHNEMKYMYRAAYRKFWTESRFVLNIADIVSQPDLQEAVTMFMLQSQDQDIANITRLSIDAGRYDDNAPSICDLVRDHWADRVYPESPVTWRGLVYNPSKRQGLLEAAFEVDMWSTCNLYFALDTSRMDADRLEEAMRIINRQSLTKGEIIAVIEFLAKWLVEGLDRWGWNLEQE